MQKFFNFLLSFEKCFEILGLEIVGCSGASRLPGARVGAAIISKNRKLRSPNGNMGAFDKWDLDGKVEGEKEA